MPTIIPPKDWADLNEGGYWNYDMTLIKSSDTSILQQMNDKAKAGDLKPVLDAVNSLQRTGWRVNLKVLDVMQHYIDNKIDVPVLPPVLDLEKQPYPEGKPLEDSDRTGLCRKRQKKN